MYIELHKLNEVNKIPVIIPGTLNNSDDYITLAMVHKKLLLIYTCGIKINFYILPYVYMCMGIELGITSDALLLESII